MTARGNSEKFIRAAAFAAFAATANGAALAQQPRASAPADSTHATLFGIVTDNLRGGPLANAVVSIVGTDRRATTNAMGRFVLDSIAPGERQLAVTHPLLDTLGLAVLSRPFALSPGQRSEVEIHTPSLDELRARACARVRSASGAGMIFGRVLDADADTALDGAAVSLVYKDPSDAALADRVRQSRSAGTGLFAICGLPDRLSGTLQAAAGGAATADVPVVLEDDLFATAILTLGTSRASAAALDGRITDRNGAPVAGAQVAITGGTSVAVTGADGRFSLNGLVSGTRQAVVRKVGFAPATVAVNLSSRARATVAVRLVPAAQALAAVKVVGTLDDGLRQVGFSERKIEGKGYYSTPGQVEARNAQLFTDLLQSVPGLRVSNQGTGRIVESTRTSGTTSGCVNIFLDHTPFEVTQAGELDDAVRIPDVGAIESYGSATETPSEFLVIGRACATLVVWSRSRLAPH